MKKTLLFMTVFFITVFASAQTDLFFSEYCEGSGNNKGVEIYNPTDEAIDLNEYWVVRYSNGSLVFTDGGTTHLQGIIEPYHTFVLVNGQTTSSGTSPACDPEMQALADQLDGDYPAPTYMNGNDAIALLKTPNGDPPTQNNITPVDLIGEIGLGSAISGETGWSYIQDTTITYNNSAGEPVTAKVINYVVQKYATNGSDWGAFWMSWTSGHSLIRKPHVVQGVVSNPSPFVVSMEWDTVPAQLDTAGYYSYEDIWDNLGSHSCNVLPNPLAWNDQVETGNTQPVLIQVLDNDEFSSPVTLSIEQQATHGSAEIPAGNTTVISYLATPGFVGLDSITYKIAYIVNPALFATAKVYINVIDPVAVNDEAEVGNTQLAIIPVLVNDIFSTPVTLSIEVQATQGNAEISADDTTVISYLATPEFVGHDSLTYKIAYLSNPALFATAKVYINVVEGSGVEGISDKPAIIIYPNPVVSEQFTITSDKMIKSVQVFDVIGKEIYSQTYGSPIYESEVEIGRKCHGVCLVKVTFSNNISTTQKIIVK